MRVLPGGATSTRSPSESSPPPACPQKINDAVDDDNEGKTLVMIVRTEVVAENTCAWKGHAAQLACVHSLGFDMSSHLCQRAALAQHNHRQIPCSVHRLFNLHTVQLTGPTMVHLSPMTLPSMLYLRRNCWRMLLSMATCMPRNRHTALRHGVHRHTESFTYESLSPPVHTHTSYMCLHTPRDTWGIAIESSTVALTRGNTPSAQQQSQSLQADPCPRNASPKSHMSHVSHTGQPLQLASEQITITVIKILVCNTLDAIHNHVSKGHQSATLQTGVGRTSRDSHRTARAGRRLAG